MCLYTFGLYLQRVAKKINKELRQMSDILGSHGYESEEGCLLKFCSV
jgi:hypothetical protein